MTRTSKSKYEFYQEASLSQQLSDKIPILQKLSGTDLQISESIGILSYFGEQGMMNKKDLDFILGLLDVLRLAHFATSERINEITKMGLMMPKSVGELDYDDETE